jgi:hypothetical protein
MGPHSRFLRQGFIFFIMFSISQASSAFTYTIEITERSLQEKIDAMMPLTRKQFFITVTLSEPKINLIKDSNEVGFFTHVEVLVPGGLKGSGRGKIQGTVSYKPERGEFYLHNPSIVSLEIDRLPKKLMPKISQIAGVILSKSLSQYPVYKLKDSDSGHQLAKATLKSIKVGDDKLLVTLGMF